MPFEAAHLAGVVAEPVEQEHVALVDGRFRRFSGILHAEGHGGEKAPEHPQSERAVQWRVHWPILLR